MPKRAPLTEMPKLSAAISEIEKQLGAEGRVLVRWSGTEAKLRVMAEGPNDAQLREYVARMLDEARLDLGATPQ
jgi:phosphoglucosamine mutase